MAVSDGPSRRPGDGVAWALDEGVGDGFTVGTGEGAGEGVEVDAGVVCATATVGA